MVIAFIIMVVAGAAAVAGIQVRRTRRRSADAEAWILVANVNTLLRLDLDHLAGDDDNAGLREMRARLKEIAATRSPSERKLLERFNALVGVAITFGERMQDAHGGLDMRAVVNRRVHVQNALALGDRIEAALGGIAELARDTQSPAAAARTLPKPAVAVATPYVREDRELRPTSGAPVRANVLAGAAPL